MTVTVLRCDSESDTATVTVTVTATEAVSAGPHPAGPGLGWEEAVIRPSSPAEPRTGLGGG